MSYFKKEWIEVNEPQTWADYGKGSDAPKGTGMNEAYHNRLKNVLDIPPLEKIDHYTLELYREACYFDALLSNEMNLAEENVVKEKRKEKKKQKRITANALLTIDNNKAPPLTLFPPPKQALPQSDALQLTQGLDSSSQVTQTDAQQRALPAADSSQNTSQNDNNQLVPFISNDPKQQQVSTPSVSDKQAIVSTPPDNSHDTSSTLQPNPFHRPNFPPRFAQNSSCVKCKNKRVSKVCTLSVCSRCCKVEPAFCRVKLHLEGKPRPDLQLVKLLDNTIRTTHNTISVTYCSPYSKNPAPREIVPTAWKDYPWKFGGMYGIDNILKSFSPGYIIRYQIGGLTHGKLGPHAMYATIGTDQQCMEEVTPTPHINETAA